RAANCAIENRAAAKSKWLRHESKSGSRGFDLPQIAGLDLYIQARSLTDCAIQVDCSLWEPDITLFNRDFLLCRRVSRVHASLFGDRGRLRLCYRSLELGIGASDKRIEGFSPAGVDLTICGTCQSQVRGCLCIDQRLNVR